MQKIISYLCTSLFMLNSAAAYDCKVHPSISIVPVTWSAPNFNNKFIVTSSRVLTLGDNSYLYFGIKLADASKNMYSIDTLFQYYKPNSPVLDLGPDGFSGGSTAYLALEQMAIEAFQCTFARMLTQGY